VFVKGLIKSRKESGWEACLAHAPADLAAMLERAKRHEVSERGVLIAREILRLRCNGHQVAGFPVSREYRIYLLDGRVIGSGFYWKGHDSFDHPTDEDTAAMHLLAITAAGRLRARLAAVDVGQLEDETWRVIELGDPQFSGVAHMPHHLFWHALQTQQSDP
jgi:hypothetical protein